MSADMKGLAEELEVLLKNRVFVEQFVRDNAPAILTALRSHDAMREALERIERWHGEFPATGAFWDKQKTQPMSYGALYGSNGERDFMRAIARAALTGAAT